MGLDRHTIVSSDKIRRYMDWVKILLDDTTFNELRKVRGKPFTLSQIKEYITTCFTQSELEELYKFLSNRRSQ